jgi:hypothetical protein
MKSEESKEEQKSLASLNMGELYAQAKAVAYSKPWASTLSDPQS